MVARAPDGLRLQMKVPDGLKLYTLSFTCPYPLISNKGGKRVENDILGKKLIEIQKEINLKSLKNNVYSVDMVRLKRRTYDDEVQEFFNKYSCDSNVKYWETSKFKSYRYNWLFQAVDPFGNQQSFWCGYCHNAERKSNKHGLIIEYNPNKCEFMPYLWQILCRFFHEQWFVEVVSVDLACDMPVNILNLSYSIDGRGGVVRKLFDYGSDNKTYYIGEGDGRKKIYNKGRELGLKDVDLTRFEISLDANQMLYQTDDFEFPKDKLIEIYNLENYQYRLDINGTDRALIYAIMNGFPINELPRTKRQKIEQILSESAGNTLDSIQFQNAYILYFKQLKDTIERMKFQM